MTSPPSRQGLLSGSRIRKKGSPRGFAPRRGSGGVPQVVYCSPSPCRNVWTQPTKIAFLLCSAFPEIAYPAKGTCSDGGTISSWYPVRACPGCGSPTELSSVLPWNLTPSVADSLSITTSEPFGCSSGSHLCKKHTPSCSTGVIPWLSIIQSYQFCRPSSHCCYQSVSKASSLASISR